MISQFLHIMYLHFVIWIWTCWTHTNVTTSTFNNLHDIVTFGTFNKTFEKEFSPALIFIGRVLFHLFTCMLAFFPLNKIASACFHLVQLYQSLVRILQVQHHKEVPSAWYITLDQKWNFNLYDFYQKCIGHMACTIIH